MGSCSSSPEKRQSIVSISCQGVPYKKTSKWEKDKMKGASPRSNSTCTRSASNSWISTKTVPSPRMISVLLLTMLVNVCPKVNWTTCWEKLEVHAHSKPLSTCSRRKWLEAPMIPMISLFVHSRHTKAMAKLKPNVPTCPHELWRQVQPS